VFEVFGDQSANFQLAFSLSFCRCTVFRKSEVFKNHLIQSLHGEIYIDATPAEIIETVKKFSLIAATLGSVGCHRMHEARIQMRR